MHGHEDTKRQAPDAPMKVATEEARLGRLASAATSGSLVLLAAVLALAGASIAAAWWLLPAAAACVGMLLAQVYFLSTLGRRPPALRLRIWKLSLLLHGIVFAIAYGMARDPAVFALLLPEALSAALHLPGIRHASRSLQGA